MEHFSFTVGICTLGCKVNQYESEAIAEAFEARGAKVLPHTEKCDVYVVNTCTVTAESDRKGRQQIRRQHQKNPDAPILVTGCLSQTAPLTLTELDGIHYLCGNTNKLSVVDEAFRLMSQKAVSSPLTVAVEPIENAPFEPMSITKFDRTRAYVKIEDGCENHCTYCIIPSARGPIRSKTPEDILHEVQILTEGGCREVVLTGIETASYGRDLGNTDLASLLSEVSKIPNIGRIRLGSLDPSLITPRFVEAIASLPTLAPHFHLSLQSGSSRILALMKRKYNAEMAMRAICLLRDAIPHVKFTTDVITGFPGETEEDFALTEEFVKQAEFLMLHIFPFSARKGTPAAAMSGQIPVPVRRERAERLIALGNEIRGRLLACEIAQRSCRTVLFEGYKNGMALGHTDDFIEVALPSPRPLHGELKQVELTHTDGTLCFARPAPETGTK